jgi:D-serine dehydratase
MPTLLSSVLKGYPHHAPALPVGAVGQQGWHLLAGDLPLPVAVLKQAPLAHNIGWLQALVARAGVDLAPHGKTTLSPEIFRQQLAPGASALPPCGSGAKRCKPALKPLP